MTRLIAMLGLSVMMGTQSLLAEPPIAEGRFDGRPVFREGFDRGFYVWRDGNRWHVRWTSAGRPHTFSGQVIADGGELHDLDRVDLEGESRLVRTGSRPVLVRGRRGRLHYESRPTTAVVTRELDQVEKDGDRLIRFHARSDADIDGFDFEVDRDVRALRFVLEIDGETRPLEVEVGRENRRPEGNPFTVVLR